MNKKTFTDLVAESKELESKINNLIQDFEKETSAKITVMSTEPVVLRLSVDLEDVSEV